MNARPSTRPPTSPRRSSGSGASANGSRPIPHDPALEQAIVGCALYHPHALDVAVEVQPEDFHRPAHRAIWNAALVLRDKGSVVDPITVGGLLADLGELDLVGGLQSLISLQADGASLSALPTYVRRLQEFAEARQFIAISSELAEKGYTGDVESARRLLNEHARNLVSHATPTLPWEDVTPAVRGEMPSITPTLLRRTDGAALLYPGLSHSIAGEPGKAKTWLALIAAAQTLESGGRVVMLDYEGTPLIVGGRLRALGASPDAVAERFSYLRPGQIGPTETAALSRFAGETHPDLVVVDGVAKAVARQGGDEDRAADVLAWIEAVVHPFGCNGTAVVMLDHVVKAKDGRGRWARGSGAKLGEIEGAAYTVETIEPFSRTRPGRVDIRIAKDREGVVGSEGELAAVVRFTPAPDDRLTVVVDPPGAVPVDCEAAILKVVGDVGEITESQLLKTLSTLGFRFRHSTVIETAESLAVHGQVLLSRGARNAKIYRVRPEVNT